jgi:hypothetical protein
MRELLEQAVPAYTGPAGDWSAVLRDAGVRRRRIQVRLALAAAAAAAVIVAVAWPGSPPSIAERALAATGSGGVLHIVTDTDLPKLFVDLDSGERREVRGLREVWFDPAHGMRQRETFEGVTQSDVTMTSIHPHAREVYASLGAGYREALESGEARVVGEEVLEGTPVYWIRIVPGHEVAVSRESYLPVHFRIVQDGMPPLDTRILEYETVDAAPLRAEQVAPPDDITQDGGVISLREAERLLGRPPLTTGRPDAIRRVDLGGTPGVALESGGVLLTEAAEPVDALTMLAGLRGYVPPEGTLVLEGMSGLMRSRGLFVAIHSPDQETTIAVARALH